MWYIYISALIWSRYEKEKYKLKIKLDFIFIIFSSGHRAVVLWLKWMWNLSQSKSTKRQKQQHAEQLEEKFFFLYCFHPNAKKATTAITRRRSRQRRLVIWVVNESKMKKNSHKLLLFAIIKISFHLNLSYFTFWSTFNTTIVISLWKNWQIFIILFLLFFLRFEDSHFYWLKRAQIFFEILLLTFSRVFEETFANNSSSSILLLAFLFMHT